MRPPEPPPTATPTEPYAYTEAEDVTARAIVRRCTYYLRLVDRWNPDFHLDPVLVLSIMAQESHCLTTATDPFSESLGLMQVNPANGLASAESLSSPALNVYWGMRVFWLVLNDEERNPQHDLTIALQAYNCGWRDKCGVGKDLCAQKGQTCGSDYADRILRFWYPRVWDVMLERGLLPDDLQTPVP
jgi:soluble lytic murein transglycosylase-like protein